MNYNQKDIFIERATNTGTFEEYALRAQPNSILMTDAYGNLVMVPTPAFAPMQYSSSTSALIPQEVTGSTYVNVTQKLLFIYSGTQWMSSSLA